MKKVLKILALIMLIITMLKIGDTYAKYYSEAIAELEQSVGQWVIKINDMDIYSETGQTVEFDMDIQNLVADENTMPGKISPGSTWAADIKLDPSGTDVAVRYDIEVSPAQIETVDAEYHITAIDGETQVIKTGANKFTGIITLAEVQENKQAQIRCSVIWNNNEERNTEDTQLAGTSQSIEIPLTIKCTQYLGEEIEEYTE